jgi:hypothetical protein
MQKEELQSRIILTPFVKSFIGNAREGSLHDPDPVKRAHAWTSWCLDSLEEFSGFARDRKYVCIVLPGRFYDKKFSNTGENSIPVRPHLEIPEYILSKPDPQFSDRLAQAGNALEFPWWVKSEATAVKRAIFSGARGDISSLVNALNSHRLSLVDAVVAANVTAGQSWHIVEEKLVTSPEEILSPATDTFTTAEISAFFPAAASLGLTIVYEEKLADDSKEWAVRRIGVWQMRCTSKRGPATLGVITPRLTRSSLFADPLFNPQDESPAALLVRALLLRRLIVKFIQGTLSGPLVPNPATPGPGGPYLQAKAARSGAKLPEASVASAVHFLQTFPEASNAWIALTRWAGSAYILTVDKDGFISAHTNALRYMRRAEPPDRQDINVILPLAFDTERARVVRATFSKPA